MAGNHISNHVKFDTTIVHTTEIDDNTMCRVWDMLSDLECNIAAEFGYEHGLRVTEHSAHMPPESLTGEELDDIGLFDEQAEHCYAISRKMVCAAIAQMGWFEENLELMEKVVHSRKVREAFKE